MQTITPPIRPPEDDKHLAAWQARLEAQAARTPGDAGVLIELSKLMFRRGQMRAASHPLLQACRQLPRNVPLILELVQRLVASGEIVAARACLDLLAQAPSPPVDVLATQAHLHFMIGDLPTAGHWMERAIAAGADSPSERHMHAMLLQFNGRNAEAQAVLEQALARWPGFGDAATMLANLRRQTPEANRLDWLDSQLHALPPADGDPDRAFVRAEFEHARFKTLDDLGRRDEAWAALSRCNALMHALNPYDAAAEEAVSTALRRLAPASAPATPAPAGPTPIFIVGLPRSGTTLLDRILSSHSQVASAGEIIDFWRQLHWVADVTPAREAGLLEVIRRSERIDYRELGERYLRQTRWRAQGRAWYVDKLPANIQMVGFIRRALPHAPILHLVREPMDTCYSNYKALFGNISAYSYELGALAHYYDQYARLAKHWHAAWPGAMLDVPYTDLVQHTEATVRRVLAHCGLPEEAACLHPEHNASPVATPSSTQVREAIHTRSLGQWRHYAQQLEPLRQALGQLAGA